MLAHDEGTRAADFPLLIALHTRGGQARSAIEQARRSFGDSPEIVAPQAARPCNPFQSNLAAGGYAGFSWYLGDSPDRPEAASFGDALVQLDRLVRSLDRPFVLAGEGQGAVLAVTLALHMPDLLAGVIAEGAAVPMIEGWQLPTVSMPGVDVVLGGLDAQARGRALAVLAERNATVIEDLLSTDQTAWLQTRLRTFGGERRA